MSRPPTPISELKLVGGHVGLDFVNTVGEWGERDSDRDTLIGPREAAAWAEKVGLVDSAAQLRLARYSKRESSKADASLSRIRALREAAYRVFEAIASGANANASHLLLLTTAAERAMARRRLVPTDEGFTWQLPPVESFDDLYDVFAIAAADLLTTAPHSKLKKCGGDHCGWLFIDTSRNGKRRWCSEEDCGVSARVRSFRARHKG